MHPVGQLDYNMSRLMLFLLDRQLTQGLLLHPRRGVEKEYVATVKGAVDKESLARKFFIGVETTKGVHRTKLISACHSNGPAAHNSELDGAVV